MKVIRGIFLVVAALVVLSCAAMAPAKKRAAERGAEFPASLKASYIYTEGIKASVLENHDIALRMFERVIALDSTHSPSYYELAALYAPTDPQKALAYSRKAGQLDSTNIWYRGQLGRLLVVTGQYDSAFTIYSDLVRLSPRNPDNYRMLAALYEERKQPYTAISVLDSAEYKLGKIEELSDMKRQMLMDAGLWDKAIAESRSLINEFPWNDRNYRIIGMLYMQTGRDSLAHASLLQAVVLNPESIENLGALNSYYRSKGDIPEFFATTRQMMLSDQMDVEDKMRMIGEMKSNRAFYTENFFQIRDLITTLLIKYPGNYKVVDLYGESIIASSGVEQALTFYKGHLKDPGAPIDVFNTVLDIEAYLQRPDSLAYYAQLALARFPNNPDLYIRQGGAYAYMNQGDKALDAYEKALKYAASDSTRGVILGVIGDYYHTAGQSKKCYQYYEKALRTWPDNAMVLNNFSYYLSTDGLEGRDLDRAVEMGLKAITLSPSNPTYLDTYAWALYKVGRYAEAKKVMQQAISLDASGSTELMVHYGDILYELKEYFMASVYWKKALENGYDGPQIEERLKKIK